MIGPSLLICKGLQAPALTLPVLRALSTTSILEHRKHIKWNKQYNWRKTTNYVHGKTDNSKFTVGGVSSKQYPIKMEWRRPSSVKRIHPSAEGAGDVQPLGQIDLNLPTLRLDGSKALSEASEEVKKVLSLEYGRNKDIVERLGHEMVLSVQQHPLDFSSLEVSIAQLTVNIRDMQKKLADQAPIRNRAAEHVLKIKVDHRRVLLRRLREEDYKKFEWLLEKLGIVYKPRPFLWERVERKKHLSRLTDLWCEEFKQSKLDEMKDSLREQQPKYLRDKAESLRYNGDAGSLFPFTLSFAKVLSEIELLLRPTNKEKIRPLLNEYLNILKSAYFFRFPAVGNFSTSI